MSSSLRPGPSRVYTELYLPVYTDHKRRTLVPRKGVRRPKTFHRTPTCYGNDPRLPVGASPRTIDPIVIRDTRKVLS